MYTSFAMPKKGLNLRKFNDFWTTLTSIQFHPFLMDIFIFFDRETQDSTIDFYELVKGMDIIERGTLEQKCQYCFAMFDVCEQNYLDLFSLREVMKRSFTQHIICLEEAIQEIKNSCVTKKDLDDAHKLGFFSGED